MRVRFYVREAEEAAAQAQRLPDGLELEIWRPGRDGLGDAWRHRTSNLAWWAMARAGIFSRDGIAELTIRRDGRLLHRLIVTPRWHRFPFMSQEDLQLGDLWTLPVERGRGLARLAIAEAHRRMGSVTGRFWYVTSEDNLASMRLIESCGYRLAGLGRRTRPLGIAMLGQFVLAGSVPA